MLDQWLSVSNNTNGKYQFPVLDITEKIEPTEEIICYLARELVLAHANPQKIKYECRSLINATEEIKLNCLKQYVENEVLPNVQPLATRVGNWGEILVTTFLMLSEDFWFPIYKLRYREKRNWAMRLTDILLIKKFSTGNPLICFGEVKTRSSNSCDKDLAIKGHESLSKDDALGNSPEILNFICQMLYENNRFDEANFLSDIRTGLVEYNKRYDLFLVHEKSVWDVEVIERLNNQGLDNRLTNFSLSILQIQNLRNLIDSSYSVAWKSIEKIINE
jgi:hypothetical protein